jgi:hypothetical protein
VSVIRIHYDVSADAENDDDADNHRNTDGLRYATAYGHTALIVNVVHLCSLSAENAETRKGAEQCANRK